MDKQLLKEMLKTKEAELASIKEQMVDIKTQLGLLHGKPSFRLGDDAELISKNKALLVGRDEKKLEIEALKEQIKGIKSSRSTPTKRTQEMTSPETPVVNMVQDNVVKDAMSFFHPPPEAPVNAKEFLGVQPIIITPRSDLTPTGDPTKTVLGDFIGFMKGWFSGDFLRYFGEAIQKGFDTVKSHFNEVLGELNSDIIDPIVDITRSTFTGFMKMFGMDAERRKAMWGKMFEMITTQKIRDKLNDMKEKNQISGFGILLFAVGAIIGAVIGQLTAPFRFLGWLATRVPIIQKGVDMFVKAFKGSGFIGKMFKPLKMFINFFKKFGGILAKVPALKIFGLGFISGFKKIFWPLQVIMSVIDFVKAYQSTEGDVGTKVIAGIKNVVMKFLEMPVRLLGWLFEKFLGLFGVEVTGTGDKLMGWLGQAFDMWIGYIKFMWKWVVEKPIELLKFIFEGLKSFLDDFGVTEWVSGVTNTVVDFFTNISNTIGDAFKELWGAIKDKDILGSIMGIFSSNKKEEAHGAALGGFVKTTGLVNVHAGEVIGPIEKIIDSPSKIITRTKNEINEKKNEIEKQKIITSKNLENIIKESNIRVADAIGQQTGELGNTINANVVQQSQSGGSSKESIPDEIENFGILLMNKSWGMG
jgi:hypothetical protein